MLMSFIIENETKKNSIYKIYRFFDSLHLYDFHILA